VVTKLAPGAFSPKQPASRPIVRPRTVILTADESEEMELRARLDHVTAMIKDPRQLDHAQKPFSADQWRSSSPAVMLGTALLLAVVAFVV
jgi:hypothetical protein